MIPATNECKRKQSDTGIILTILHIECRLVLKKNHTLYIYLAKSSQHHLQFNYVYSKITHPYIFIAKTSQHQLQSMYKAKPHSTINILVVSSFSNCYNTILAGQHPVLTALCPVAKGFLMCTTASALQFCLSVSEMTR